MKFKADEIASVIQKEIEDFRGEIETSEVGRVLEVGDGIARVYGLSSAMSGEMVEFSNGVRGQVFNLEENSVGIIIFGDYLAIAEGDEVRSTGKLLSVPVGDELLGRVVDPLGNPLDGKGPIVATESRPLEVAAPGVAARQPVKQPMATGIKAIDAMTPVGRGQRELIIGDRKTGKTAIAIDTILNQKGKDVICVYVGCGQRAATIAGIVNQLTEHGAMDYTVVVSATASDPAPLQYIAPYAGAAIAEHYMYQGKHTLVVYDDLSKQAQAYRQLSLLMRRPPGREAYPGDVFYCHSRLLERSARLSDELGGGSMTALPIIETLEGEVSAYIPTNVISITDGQIYLEPDLFFAGIRPAINVGISVSRVGGNAQTKATKSVSGSLRLDLAAFRELEAFAQMGTELDKATQAQLDRGYRMVELLKQPQFNPMPMADQVVSLYAGTKGFFDTIPIIQVQAAEAEMLQFIHDQYPEITDKIEETGKLEDDIIEQLKPVLTTFVEQYLRKNA
ncbi:MAG: F0F1 ATP synthase subunit alpha [Planctomycetes bacterium]|nr:F0F1 ATP synthase subunit alpha [Planctomycetota bacterium]MCH9726342.1 F0F1 ATP synthase subunit alpha [Planctomycetota bacterium]MCH9776343.1 F0F1 ATP synthase subunit alpha [Planctomycetota bacterium]MCH9793469.1 F0F1 ATP synthase subunit alpha [Planctomycetota bacterium]